jgi:hypothetical protein
MIIITILCILCIFGLRILVSAFFISIFIKVVILARTRLSPTVRSWFWGAAFLGLFIPFERSFTFFTRGIYIQIITQSIAVLQHLSFARYLPYVLQCLPFLWFAGFLFFAVKTAADANRTYRSLQNGTIQVCGAYFSK